MGKTLAMLYWIELIISCTQIFSCYLACYIKSFWCIIQRLLFLGTGKCFCRGIERAGSLYTWSIQCLLLIVKRFRTSLIWCLTSSFLFFINIAVSMFHLSGSWLLSGRLAKMLLIDCEQSDCSMTLSGILFGSLVRWRWSLKYTPIDFVVITLTFYVASACELYYRLHESFLLYYFSCMPSVCSALQTFFFDFLTYHPHAVPKTPLLFKVLFLCYSFTPLGVCSFFDLTSTVID